MQNNNRSAPQAARTKRGVTLTTAIVLRSDCALPHIGSASPSPSRASLCRQGRERRHVLLDILHPSLELREGLTDPGADKLLSQQAPDVRNRSFMKVDVAKTARQPLCAGALGARPAPKACFFQSAAEDGVQLLRGRVDHVARLVVDQHSRHRVPAMVLLHALQHLGL